jgi:hypothetical protein
MKHPYKAQFEEQDSHIRELSRFCLRSKTGEHNFSVPGEDCANACGVNQYDLSGIRFRKVFGEVTMRPSDFEERSD